MASAPDADEEAEELTEDEAPEEDEEEGLLEDDEEEDEYSGEMIASGEEEIEEEPEEEEPTEDLNYYNEIYKELLSEDPFRKSSTDLNMLLRILDYSNVEKLLNRLSKVKLVWPENLPLFNYAEYKKSPKHSRFPETFYTCTQKEKAVLFHAENFRRQFSHNFPNRRPLVIAPKNECYCQKLYPTFINPTVLGYPEFFNCESLMDFLKDFLRPEMFIKHPNKYPSHIRSHVPILKHRKANAFEFSIVATSFLLGSGYDAYVVDGYADQTVTTMSVETDYTEEEVEVDTERKIPPDERAIKELRKIFKENTHESIVESKEDSLPPVSPSKYSIIKKKDVLSEYELAMEDKKNQILMEALRVAEEERQKYLLSLIKPPEPDKFENQRTHAWILLLPGKREITVPTFLEPFSGKSIPVSEASEFKGIESVFNNKNFYVNLKDPFENIQEMEFDLEDTSCWNKLLWEPFKKPKTAPGSASEAASSFGAEETEETKQMELYLDMPISWTPEPVIAEEDYDKRYPDGKKNFEYKNALVELAVPYANDDGLVKRVIKFEAETRDPNQIYVIDENFMNRKDRLIQRLWFKQSSMLHEKFETGRRDALKEHIHESGKNNPFHPRVLHYYADAHPQNVLSREIKKRELVEYFDNRQDRLYYRDTIYGGILCHTKPAKDKGRSSVDAMLAMEMDEGGAGRNKARRQILEIVEKYHRDDSKPFDEDIAEKHMLIEEGILRIIYQYDEGAFVRNSLEFYKPKDVSSDQIDFKPQDCIEFTADRYAVRKDLYQRFQILDKATKDERRSINMVRIAEDEIFETVNSRVQEDWHHELAQDAFIVGETSHERPPGTTESGGDSDADYRTGEVDFTSPYIEKYGLPINKQEELNMKKRIVRDFKRRMIKKVHLMKQKYDEECLILQDRKNLYKKTLPTMSHNEKEDFNHEIEERKFKMKVSINIFQKLQDSLPEYYQKLLNDIATSAILNRFQVVTPEEVISHVELTEAEKLRLAMELAKARDCCQFYYFKYVEPKEEKDKDKEQDAQSKAA